MNKSAARYAQHSARRAAGSYGPVFAGSRKWARPMKKEKPKKPPRSATAKPEAPLPSADLERQARIYFNKCYAQLTAKQKLKAQTHLKSFYEGLQLLKQPKTKQPSPAAPAVPAAMGLLSSGHVSVEAKY